MHRWIIACIVLALMAQSALVYGQTDPSYLKGEEWTDEAGAKVTTLYFTLGDKEWPNEDPFRMVVIGDSIAWGCGLYTKEKYHYLVADWLQKTLKRPVEVTVLAHTGATIVKPTNTDASKHAFVDPELGSWDPVLLEQAEHIPNPGDVDLILVSGGINDVGVDTLIVPIDNSYTINDRCQDVKDSMNILLRVLLNKCDKSLIIVTGYYAVVSKDTPSSSINRFADFIKENDPNWLHRTFSSKISNSADIISDNCAKFYSESIESLSDSKGGAVYSANEYSRANFGKDRVYFAAVDFPSDRSYGTSNSLLWELLDTDNGGKTNDHKYYYRVSLCDRVSCNWDDKIQAIAHPNVEGDQQYNLAIQKVLEQKLSDFGLIPTSNEQASSAEPEQMQVVDFTPPNIQAFQVMPQSLAVGESFTIDYTVSDEGGSGLKQVELWRKDESSGWQQISTTTLTGETGPLTGSFIDSPSSPGNYWYGVHVVDNAGNWNDEQNSNTKGQPSGFAPIEVQVNPLPVTLTLYVHNGSADGLALSGVEVTGQDLAGKSFSQITDANGFVVIIGAPGSWQFTVTKPGYDINSWSQEITETGTKHAYLFPEEIPTKSMVENEAQSTAQGIISGSETSMDGELGNLINALKDKDAGVRLKAAEELGKLADPRAVDPLIEILRNDENRDVRTKAAWALGQIDDTRTVDPLSYASVKDADGYVRGEAYNALQKNTAGGNKVDSRSVDPIIDALKDDDEEVRYRAAEALGILKDAGAVDPLIDVLRNDENRDVRTKAAWALGQIDDARTVDPLSYASVKDADGYVRGEAYNALQKNTAGGNKVDSRSVDPIIEALKDNDQEVRYRAAEALGKIKNATAVGPLIDVLGNDENRDVRTKAAWALGQIDDTRTVDPLSYASVKDADGYVRGEAYNALQKNTAGGNKVDSRSVDPIIEALKDENPEVRYRAAEALGMLKDAAAVDPLIDVLRNDENRDVRTKAAWALGQIDDTRTVDPLSYASVKDADGYVRGEAYNALQKNTAGGNKVDSRSVDPIIEALKDDDEEVRYRAAEALGILKDAGAVDPLIGVLRNDENRDVRTKAAWALGEIGDAQAVDPLNYAYVKDADGYVRGEAKNALAKLGQQVE